MLQIYTCTHVQPRPPAPAAPPERTRVLQVRLPRSEAPTAARMRQQRTKLSELVTFRPAQVLELWGRSRDGALIDLYAAKRKQRPWSRHAPPWAGACECPIAKIYAHKSLRIDFLSPASCGNMAFASTPADASACTSCPAGSYFNSTGVRSVFAIGVRGPVRNEPLICCYHLRARASLTEGAVVGKYCRAGSFAAPFLHSFRHAPTHTSKLTPRPRPPGRRVRVYSVHRRILLRFAWWCVRAPCARARARGTHVHFILQRSWLHVATFVPCWAVGERLSYSTLLSMAD